jgi:hypothetical protein
METAKNKKAATSVILLNKQDITEKPDLKVSVSELKTLGRHYNFEIDFKKSNSLNPLGFNLNAANPTEKNRAGLMVPVNKDVTVNSFFQPYFYQFIQASMADVWWGTSHNKGKVIIHFDPIFRIDNGVIFLRVGGNHGYFIISGTGFFVKVGNGPKRFYPITKTQPHEDGNYDFVSQTIPLVFYTPPNTQRIGSLPDIEITSDLPVWKFFSADYNPMTILKK